MSKKPTVISLFSGAMGLDLGLEKAGFKILASVENEKNCIETLTIKT
jgi:DNA (cytosine-5)-methyltransferase 1